MTGSNNYPLEEAMDELLIGERDIGSNSPITAVLI